jgi:hypothetical protein
VRCSIALALLAAVLAFALVGLSVAGQDGDYAALSWIPRLLAVLSAFLILTTVWRIVRRWIL